MRQFTHKKLIVAHTDPIYRMVQKGFPLGFKGFVEPALKSPVEGWAVSPSACTTEAISAFTSLESSFHRCRKSSQLPPPSCNRDKLRTSLETHKKKLAELRPSDPWALPPRILVLRQKKLFLAESHWLSAPRFGRIISTSVRVILKRSLLP